MGNILELVWLKLVRGYICVFDQCLIIVGVHRDMTLDLLKESIQLESNQDYETWMRKESEIYNILLFDHISLDCR